MTTSARFHWGSLSLWGFPWLFLLILRRSSSFRIVQFLLLPFLLPCVFVSLVHLSGSSGFRGFLLGFLLHYRLSSTSSMAIHFYPLSCPPLGSFPRLSSSSTPFRVFFAFPGFQAALHWLFFLFISSFEFFFFPLPLSLLLVRLLALGALVLLIFLLFPTLFPGCACWSFAGLASFHLPFPPFHLSFVS